MRCAVLALVLAAYPLAADAKLYALNHTANLPNVTAPGAFRLLTMQDDGTAAPVGDATIPWTPGATAVDHEHGILYFIGSTSYIGTNTTLVGVSLKTGAVVSTAAIPFVGPGYELFAANLVYASDLGGQVLVLVTTSTNQQVLGKIDPETGTWTTITTVFGPTVVKQDQTSMVYCQGKVGLCASEWPLSTRLPACRLG
jgi:hypothetical protein